MTRCVFLVAWLAAAPAAADAHPAQRAAITGIDLGPRVPAYLRDKAIAQIEGGLAAAGYEVVPSAQASAQLSAPLAGCRTGGCLVDVGGALHVDALVTASIEAKDESTIVVMRLFDGSTGAQLAEVHEVCDLCGESEITERVGLAASALRAQATEAHARKEAVTVTPLVQPAAPRPAPPADHGSAIPGFALGGAGLVALGAGVYLIHLDGQGTCHPGDTPVYPAPGAVIRYPDAGDQTSYVCRNSYDTQTLGIVAAGVGALALVAGAYLVVHARHQDIAVEVAPTAGGASARLGWRW